MTPPRKAAAGLPADWLAHAESDLRLARLAASDENVIPSQSCFHAQQAVEKSLKAVLLVRGVDFPPSHDIEGLLVISEQNGVQIPDGIGDAALLTPYAVETRYPGYLEDVSRKDAWEAITVAEKAVAWAQNIVTLK
jgi:HEPN domain-containing protein